MPRFRLGNASINHYKSCFSLMDSTPTSIQLFSLSVSRGIKVGWFDVSDFGAEIRLLKCNLTMIRFGAGFKYSLFSPRFGEDFQFWLTFLHHQAVSIWWVSWNSFFFAGCSVEEGFGAGLSVMQISLPCRTVEAQKHLKAHPLEKHLDECCLEDFITWNPVRCVGVSMKGLAASPLKCQASPSRLN